MRLPDAPTRKNGYRQLRIRIVLGLRKVVLLEDGPARLARGSAAGIFCSALPVFGQTLVGLVLAKVIGGNPLASIPWSWISNPLTTVPMWYGGYRIGLILLPGDREPIAYEDLAAMAAAVTDSGWSDGIAAMLGMLGDLLLPLWLGCTVMGLAMAIPGYLLIVRVAAGLQARRERQRARWSAGVSAPVSATRNP